MRIQESIIMEYNYTREFKQPNKIYSLPNGKPIPFAPNGLRMEYLVVGGIFALLLVVIIFASILLKISFLQSLFLNYWLLIIAAVGVLVWTLFSLKWDNKNFLDYVLGRGTYYQNKNKRYEHEMLVPFYKKKITYSKRKRK